MSPDASLSVSVPLLQAGDPPAVEIVNPGGRCPAVLLCDHASNAVPRRLADLGLDAATLARHIAWDIGAAAVTRALAAALDAPAILAGYSRLVIDLNRDPDDPTAICVISDRSIVPGNRDLSAADRAARVRELFAPYHAAIARTIDARSAGAPPAVIALHSFTPTIAGWGHDRQQRPWHVGVLYDRDFGLAAPLLERLRARGDLVVGDNQPYSAKTGHGYTLARHAEPRRLANVEIELRQDLIGDAVGVARLAAILAEALTPLVARG